MPRSRPDNRSSCTGFILRLILGFLVIATASYAELPAHDKETQTVHLEVFINDWSTGLITRFVDIGDGTLLANADELCRTGIRPIIDGRRQQGDILVNDIDGVVFDLDQVAQTIYFTADLESCSPRVIEASPQPRDLLPDEISSGLGLVLNYNLDAEVTRSHGLSRRIAGDFDARFFMPLGTLNHGFALTQSSGEGRRYRRLNTYWRTALPNRASQIQIGDLTTRGPGWSRPVRLGGVQIERNFEMRPDLVTIALPSYEGSAAVPSTVEVYADSLRRFSADVPYGPFRLQDLPFSTGTTDAEIVLRDITGRETRVARSFFVTSELMRPGLVDYSVALGTPRLGIGTATDRYEGGYFGVGTMRFGATEWLTLEAHSEIGRNLRLGGVGATFRVGMSGTASASLAHSRSEIGSGSLAEVSTRLRFGRLRASGRVMRSWGDYADIARLTALTANASASSGHAPPEPLSAINQLSLALAPLQPGDGTSSLFYSDTRRIGGEREHSLGLSYTRQVFERSTLSLSAIATRGDSSNAMVSLGLHVPLGRNRSSGTRIDNRSGRLRGASYVQSWPEGGQEGWHWRAQVVGDTQSEVSARAQRRSQHGRLELAARHSNTSQSLRVGARGAVAIAGGGVFMADRIEDSFAVVNAGAPGIEVRHENRPVGLTGSTGRLLVPGLRSYQRNILSISPDSLPLDADIPRTREIVRPAQRSGVVLDFGIDPAPATALVELIDATGAPVAVGMPVVLSRTGERYLVGYDGLVFLRGLEARNELVVHFPDLSTCRASFDYARLPGTIPQIEGVLCE